ncbi:MAG: ZIP family metal transporter [Patescibacteria group bacterium]
MLSLILYSLLAGLFSLLGGALVIWRSAQVMKFINPLITFGAGAFLGVSFLDLLPEAVEMVEEPHPVFIAAVVGFFLFFALERTLMRYMKHSHEKKAHDDHTESLPVLVVIGDTFHNFLDGIVIGLAFVANPLLGLPTALAIAAHEIPQEIGDFAILLDQGWSKGKIFLINILSSLLTIVGALVGYLAVGLFQPSLPYLLAGTAGVFLYIAASDLIPEIHHRAGHKALYSILFFFLLGLVSIGYLVSLAH